LTGRRRKEIKPNDPYQRKHTHGRTWQFNDRHRQDCFLFFFSLVVSHFPPDGGGWERKLLLFHFFLIFGQVTRPELMGTRMAESREKKLRTATRDGRRKKRDLFFSFPFLKDCM
jgi:hypothetical protein